MARCSLPRRCRPIGGNTRRSALVAFSLVRATQKQAIAVAVSVTVAVAVAAFLADWSHSQLSNVLCHPPSYQVATYHQQRLDLDAFISRLSVSASPILGRCRPASCLRPRFKIDYDSTHYTHSVSALNSLPPLLFPSAYCAPVPSQMVVFGLSRIPEQLSCKSRILAPAETHFLSPTFRFSNRRSRATAGSFTLV